MYSLAELVSPATKMLLLLVLAGTVFAVIVLRSAKEENTMTPTTTKVAIPAIDAAAPTETKTATFAMG